MRPALAAVLVALLSGSAIACGGMIDEPMCTARPCGPDPETPAPEQPEPDTEQAPGPVNPQPSPDEQAPSADPAPSDEACLEPYHVKAEDGRCVWSCSEGTEPDPRGVNSNAAECVCKPGLVEVGTDRFGRRVCR